MVIYTTRAQGNWMNLDAKKFGLKKITVLEVKKAIKWNGKWEGYIVGNNVNAYHINANWHLGYEIKADSMEELEKLQNNFLFYLEKELGNGIHYYEELKP